MGHFDPYVWHSLCIAVAGEYKYWSVNYYNIGIRQVTDQVIWYWVKYIV